MKLDNPAELDKTLALLADVPETSKNNPLRVHLYGCLLSVLLKPRTPASPRATRADANLTLH